MHPILIALCVLAFVSSTSAEAAFVSINDIALPQALKGKDLKGIPTKIQGVFSVESFDVPSTQLLVSLGQGFDIFTGRLLPDVPCIAAVRPDLSLGFAEVGQHVNHEYINTVSNLASYESASNSSVGFDFTYKLFTAGFDQGTHSTSYFNSVDEFARVYRRIITKAESRVGGDWSKNARSLIQKDLKRFTEVCGTHYIRSIYWGHLIDETLRFTLRTDKYTTADENSLSLGVKDLFGFDYSNTQSETSVKELSAMTFISQSRGVLAKSPVDPTKPGGVKALVVYARMGFPEAVLSSKPEQSSILGLELEPYWRLNVDHAAKLPRWHDSLINAMQARLTLYEQLVSAVSEINFALKLSDTHFTQFYKGTKPEATKKQARAEQIHEGFRKSIELCQSLLALPDGSGAQEQCENSLKASLTSKAVQAVMLERI